MFGVYMLEKFRESRAVRSGSYAEGVGDGRDGDERTDDDDDDDELAEENDLDGMRSGKESGTEGGVGGAEAVLM